MLSADWQFAPPRHRTVGADKAYDTADFVDQVRELDMTPHVAQNDTRRGGSAIDARTTRHAGYAMSQHARPRIERAFAWLKAIAGVRKVKLRGLPTVNALFVFASAAFNIKRIVTFRAAAACGAMSGNWPRFVLVQRDARSADFPCFDDCIERG
jgi:IS5 family transposase